MARLVVALTTFNGERHLEEQLVSIGDQRLSPDEVYVSDDFSQDGTWEILQAWAVEQSFPVLLHRNPRTLGVVANMETLLRRAARAGEIVVLCDQDDRWDREKLAAVRTAFQEPSTAAWLSEGHLIDQHGHPYPYRSLWSGVHLTPSDLLTAQGKIHADGLRRLVLGVTATGAAMAVRSTVVTAATPFPAAMHRPDPPFLHDGWLALIAALQGELVLDPRPLMSYRQHQSQVTGMSLIAGGGGEGATPQPRDRAGEVRSELARLEVILEAVSSRTDSVHLRGRVDQLESLRDFLATRSRPGPLAVLRRTLRGDYRRFANGLQTSVLDLVRSIRRP